MKILYDTQTFDLQRFGGISRYFYKLTKNSGNSFDYEIAGKYSENIYIEEISKIRKFPIKNEFKGKGRIEKYFNDRYLYKAIQREDFDIYHPTYYFIKRYPEKRPTIITAHDFIHELFPEYYINRPDIIEAKKDALHKANRIIAISESTKKDLLNIYSDINENKIDVVYHAVEWEIGGSHSMKMQINRPYILFTGQRQTYKNFTLFAKAIAPLLIKYDMNLICTGSPFTKEEKEFLYNVNILDRCINKFVDEEELRALYEHAICFVFPSKYEGFGFPILEAFASRCPTVIAKASCFPEIAGNASLFFDPNDEASIRDSVELVLNSQDTRNSLIEKGIIRLQEYTMKKMIDTTVSVYAKLL